MAGTTGLARHSGDDPVEGPRGEVGTAAVGLAGDPADTGRSRSGSGPVAGVVAGATGDPVSAEAGMAVPATPQLTMHAPTRKRAARRTLTGTMCADSRSKPVPAALGNAANAATTKPATSHSSAIQAPHAAARPTRASKLGASRTSASTPRVAQFSPPIPTASPPIAAMAAPAARTRSVSRSMLRSLLAVTAVCLRFLLLASG